MNLIHISWMFSNWVHHCVLQFGTSLNWWCNHITSSFSFLWDQFLEGCFLPVLSRVSFTESSHQGLKETVEHVMSANLFNLLWLSFLVFFIFNPVWAIKILLLFCLWLQVMSPHSVLLCYWGWWWKKLTCTVGHLEAPVAAWGQLQR